MTMNEYFGDWLEVIDPKQVGFILQRLASECDDISPRRQDVFRPFRLCPYKDLKAVFLFPDPYYRPDLASGIAAGVRDDISEDRLPHTLLGLKDMVLAGVSDRSKVIFDNTLESWCRQGVLMLNGSLTCNPKTKESHWNIWFPFTFDVLRNIDSSGRNIPVVYFGDTAWKRHKLVCSRNVYRIKHPAYFAKTKMQPPKSMWTYLDDFIKGKCGTSIEWFKFKSDGQQESDRSQGA